jgi:coenzyme F420-reducing hydrogenase alpha subunit
VNGGNEMKKEKIVLTGLTKEELMKVNSKARKALRVAERKLEEYSTVTIQKEDAVLIFKYNGSVTVNMKGGQLSYEGGNYVVNGSKIKKPTFDKEKIKQLEKAIKLLKEVQMITSLEYTHMKGYFSLEDLGYEVVPSKNPEEERKRINKFLKVCDKFITEEE